MTENDLTSIRTAWRQATDVDVHDALCNPADYSPEVLEVIIREAADSTLDRPIKEEYWLRVEHKRFRASSEILGFDRVESAQEESFNCSECGNLVAEHETACSKCGARFEDD